MSAHSDRVTDDRARCDPAAIAAIIRERLGASPQLAAAMALGALETKDGAKALGQAGGWLR